MDTLDHYHQQYLSFNMNKTILEHYRDRKSMMPEVWAFLVDQAYANGHFE